MTDPVENVIAEAFDNIGLGYERNVTVDDKGHTLDFYIPAFAVYVECCRFHTPRKIAQCANVSNVIIVQGIDSANFLADIFERRDQ